MKKWISFLAFSFVIASIAQVSTPNKIQTFAENYVKAKSERTRLQLCIDAIDQGLIYRGGPVANIDQIFRSSFSKEIPAAGLPLEWGVVRFANPLPPPPSDAIAAAFTGWHLDFEFDSRGLIQNYYLSNLHK